MTILRVFLNSESSQMYYMMFKRVFQLVKDQAGQDIQFQHLHSHGIRAVAADMDKGQLSGKLLLVSRGAVCIQL